MKTILQELQAQYPRSRLHFDVIVAGADAYQVTVSLLDFDEKMIARVVHYGTKHSHTVDDLKRHALEKLFIQLNTSVDR